jgi:hypothetical protein
VRLKINKILNCPFHLVSIQLHSTLRFILNAWMNDIHKKSIKFQYFCSIEYFQKVFLCQKHVFYICFCGGIWSWLAEKLHFILSYEAGFYEPTVLKVHPPFFRITSYATMPGLISTQFLHSAGFEPTTSQSWVFCLDHSYSPRNFFFYQNEFWFWTFSIRKLTLKSKKVLSKEKTNRNIYHCKQSYSLRSCCWIRLIWSL